MVCKTTVIVQVAMVMAWCKTTVIVQISRVMAWRKTVCWRVWAVGWSV